MPDIDWTLNYLKEHGALTAQWHRRALMLIDEFHGGLHHWPLLMTYGKRATTKIERSVKNHCIIYSIHNAALASWDMNKLTHLVILAHKYRLRVEVRPSGPGMLKIGIWPRQRAGGISQRHPGLHELMELANSQEQYEPEETGEPADKGGEQ